MAETPELWRQVQGLARWNYFHVRISDSVEHYMTKCGLVFNNRRRSKWLAKFEAREDTKECPICFTKGKP